MFSFSPICMCVYACAARLLRISYSPTYVPTIIVHTVALFLHSFVVVVAVVDVVICTLLESNSSTRSCIARCVVSACSSSPESSESPIFANSCFARLFNSY